MKKHETKIMKLADLTAAPYNPRKIDDDALDGLVESVKRFGMVQPIVWNKQTGNVCGGHQRIKALTKLGIEETEVLIVDIPLLEEKALNVTMNNPAIAGTFTDDLQSLLQDIKIDLDEIDYKALMLDDFEFPDIEIIKGNTDPDDVPETPKEPISKPGDLWILGNHRLLCGDCTKANDVDRVMDGEKAQMIFTDPPYGVNYTGGMKKRDELKADKVGTDIYFQALPMLWAASDDNVSLYLWYAAGHAAAAATAGHATAGHAAAAAAAAAGFQIVAQIIWAKNHAQFMTLAHYKGKHEPCYYGHKNKKAARWHGPNNEVTLWEYNRAASNNYHPTQKPVELATRALKNSTEQGHIVIDFFCGSGSTIIAAEQLNRRCFAIEIEPKYVDVAVRRWEEFAGKKAELKQNPD